MRKLVIFLKGIVIGIALVLPGLSGSLMAVLLGMYEELIGKIGQWRKNIPFLLFFGIGAGVGVLLSAKAVLLLCLRWPLQSNIFFFGLVLGGIPDLLPRNRRVIEGKASASSNTTDVNEHKRRMLYIAVSIISMVVIFIISGLSNAAGDFTAKIESISSIWDVVVIMLCGVVSCGLMMLPGMSGSIILLLLGQYGTVYGAVSSLSNVLRGEMPWKSLVICIVFAIGSALGVWGASKIMSVLIKRAETLVKWLIFGMTCGTCAALMRYSVVSGIALYKDNSGAEFAAVVICVVTCIAAAVAGYVATRMIKEPNRR